MPSPTSGNGPKEKPPEFPRGPIRLPSTLGDERQVLGGTLAAAAAEEFILGPLTFVQASQPGLLDGRDVHEGIGFAALRLDKAIALGRVEPLHNSGLQFVLASWSKDDAPGETRRREIASACSGIKGR